MTFNPPFDPSSAREQQRRSEQAAKDSGINQPVSGVYSTGSTPVATTNVTNTEVVTPRDRVRWGPILAGLVTALATLLILSLLGVAVGLTAATGDPNGGANAAATKAGNYGTGAAIWAAIAALLAFFLGGYIAARTSALRDRTTGWINGALVWAVALPALLWLATSGGVGFLNAIGFNLGSFIETVNPSNPASPINSASPANPANNPGATQAVTETVRNGAWWTLAALLLGLVSAGLGGLLGGRRGTDDDVSITR